MTKKHFISFANKIADMKNRNEAQAAADVVVSVAREVNPRFDESRFLTACNL